MSNYVETVSGESFVISIETANTGVYAHPVVITDATYTISQAVESDVVANTVNLSSPAATVRRTHSVDRKIDGNGFIHQSDQLPWQVWAEQGGPKNLKVTQTGTGGWTQVIPMLMTNYQIGAGLHKSQTGQITFEQAGPPANAVVSAT